jgi:hypothetical protein
MVFVTLLGIIPGSPKTLAALLCFFPNFNQKNVYNFMKIESNALALVVVHHKAFDNLIISIYFAFILHSTAN